MKMGQWKQEFLKGFRLTSPRGADIIKMVIEMNVNELRQQSYEYGLPAYLQHDLDAYKEGLTNGSSLLDCLWGELYGSINIAEINEGAITHEHAEYLRNKYLWR